jgi:UDP-perosamine 4-acetyltransferase
VVFGAGGHARAVVDVIERLGESVVAVVGDPSGSAWHVEVLPDDDAGLARVAGEGLRAVVASGAANARLAVLGRARSIAGVVVAATATVGRDVELGPGTVVLEHGHVGPASHVGVGVIVNTSAVVEHDCRIGDGVHVAPGAVVLGGASVGPRTLVGSGARVLPRVVVGADVTIGAGAVVTENVPDGCTVVGVPARVADRRTGGDRS